MQTITSKDNPKLKAVRALIRSKKERRGTSCFVIEGVRALSALSDGTACPQYSLKEVWMSEAGRAVPDALWTPGASIPTYEIPRDFMEQLSDCRTSQGVLGVVEYSPAPLKIDPEQGRYLLLDRVMDPGNMGTLIRSAVAFDFDGVLLHGDCVDVFNPKTVRATMGTLPFCSHCVAAQNILQSLENLGYEMITTVLRGGTNLYEMEFGPKTVLVIGNEANGICDGLLRKSNRKLSIPMSGSEPVEEKGFANAGQRPKGVANVESLNAAVAGSICMSAMTGR